jgi:hypothetical protein
VNIRIYIFFFIFLFGCLVSCDNDPVVKSFGKNSKNAPEAGSNKIGDTKKEKLSSILYELAISPDHNNFAKKHGILLDKDRVRVFILFEPSSSDSERNKLLEDHGIMIEKSSADLTRGLVPVDHLISLSQEPVIRSLRLPDRLIKTRKTSP